MKREKQAAQKAKGKWVPPEDPFLQGLPLLAEALSDHFWDDGSPREVWTLSVNYSGPMPTVQLNDKDEGRSVASTAPSVREALEALEGLMGRGALPWRYWQQKKKGRG